MPRPRTERTTRSHHKKPAPPSPELDAMIDTITDGANPAEKPTPPRAQKPGPKKVLSETSRILGDGLASGVLIVTKHPDPRKNLSVEEARSIGHPIVRMLGRRVPDWLKPVLPKSKLNPDDAADVEEILATIMRFGLRVLSLAIADFMDAREKGQVARRAAQETSAHNAAVMHQPIQATTGISSRPAPVAQANGHNAFDALQSIDLGFVGE